MAMKYRTLVRVNSNGGTEGHSGVIQRNALSQKIFPNYCSAVDDCGVVYFYSGTRTHLCTVQNLLHRWAAR
jgi:hypothetical protein